MHLLLLFQFWIGGVIALGEYLYANNEEVISLYRLVFTNNGVIVRVKSDTKSETIYWVKILPRCGKQNTNSACHFYDLLKSSLSEAEAVSHRRIIQSQSSIRALWLVGSFPSAFKSDNPLVVLAPCCRRHSTHRKRKPAHKRIAFIVFIVLLFSVVLSMSAVSSTPS